MAKKYWGRTISLTDITELNNLLGEIRQKNITLKQQNEELIKVQEDLCRMEQSRRNLLSNISHDFALSNDSHPGVSAGYHRRDH